MAWEPLESTLRAAVLRGAIVGAGIAIVLLAPAIAAEVLGRAGVAAGLRGRLERLAPARSRIMAAALVAAALAMVSTPRAGADDSVRGWLHGTAPTADAATTTTTTRRAPEPAGTPSPGAVATPDALDERVPPGDREPVPAVPPEPTPPHGTGPGSRPAPSPPAPTLTTESHTVRRGDCLWSIAAARLGPSATAVAIDQAWRAIYAANRGAIGDDPNLIRPGLTLVMPRLAPTR